MFSQVMGWLALHTYLYYSVILQRYMGLENPRKTLAKQSPYKLCYVHRVFDDLRLESLSISFSFRRL